MAGIPTAARAKFQHAFELREVVDMRGAFRGQMMRVTGEMTQDDANLAAAYAAEKVRPFACQCLVDNWRKTGLGKTAEMMRHLRNCRVRAWVKSGKVIIRIFFDPDAESSTKYKTSPFVVMASLNWGAVRMRKIVRHVRDVVTGKLIRTGYAAPVGKSAKRTIKKYAMTGKISKRARDAIARGLTTELAGEVTKGYNIGRVKQIKVLPDGRATTTFSGGAIVIPPRKFFELTHAQRGALGAGFMKHVQEFFGMKEAQNA